MQDNNDDLASMTKRWVADTAIDRRTFIKSTGILGAGALLGSGLIQADPPVEYFFDSVGGNDSAAGTSSGTAWRGLASGKTIRDTIQGATGPTIINIARGSVYGGSRPATGTQPFGPGMLRSIANGPLSGLTIRAYGNSALPRPRFDCCDAIIAGSTDPRADTESTAGWTQVLGSNVWRLPLHWSAETDPADNEKIQRLWVGSSRAELMGLPIRVIIGGSPVSGSTYLLPSEEEIVEKLTGEMDAEFDGDLWNTFWYSGPSVEYPDDIYLYMYSETTGLNPVEDNEEIYLSRTDYGLYGLRLQGCTDFHVSDIEIWGGSTNWISLEGGSGTLQRVRCRYGNLESIGVHAIGSGVAGDFTFDDIYLDNDLDDFRFYADLEVDGSGERGIGSNDLLLVEGLLQSVTVIGGEIHDAGHAGFSCPSVTPNQGFTLTITDTLFTQFNIAYGRALNINGQRDCFAAVEISGITVQGQPTYSQLSGENIEFVDNVFEQGRAPLGAFKTRYLGLSGNKSGTAGYLAISNLEFPPSGNDRTANVWIEGCEFINAHDAPIGYYNYSTNSSERIENSVNFWECLFVNDTTPAKRMIDSNKTAGGPAIQMYVSYCKSYGYDSAMYCAAGNVTPASVSFPSLPVPPATDSRVTDTAAGYSITADLGTLHLLSHEVLDAAP
jgi:hypothetical protein